jgi:hypothetical protein
LGAGRVENTEASLKKKRRIEITAFRRTVTISGKESAAGPEKELPEGVDDRPPTGEDPVAHGRPSAGEGTGGAISHAASGEDASLTKFPLEQPDLLEALLSYIDTESSPDMEHLIEVVGSSDEDGGDNEN